MPKLDKNKIILVLLMALVYYFVFEGREAKPVNTIYLRAVEIDGLYYTEARVNDDSWIKAEIGFSTYKEAKFSLHLLKLYYADKYKGVQIEVSDTLLRGYR